ncbi:dolichol-phosphate mannosyltransferase [Ereboglobus sp. PH5-10]|uniref:glycosyltransferase n=1 Tax=Ereboglobus sp. PH5-10 TaxID=2940629 RepID=UPI0024049F74|nr:glycosyltransferase [Ereboglobus sp. PH5-10]MDF9828230.1 dolichol-phosphate mannosyltransferase [Ereboglobus sp. PH5-10]
MLNKNKIAIIIPCYKVRARILTVIATIPTWVDSIFAIDDCCPEKTGDFLKLNCRDERLTVIYNESNQGVGGACTAGFTAALKHGCDIIIKMDGDGQMDPAYLRRLIHPIESGLADFTKGNRFYHLNELQSMPLVRRIGNIGLTLLTKFASGFWHISDPTNGYLALHSSILNMFSSKRLAKRYFFETSLLVHMNIINAVACDVPIPAKYDNEHSSLSIGKSLVEFPVKLIMSLINRIILKYFIYNVNATTVLLTLGTMLCAGGGLFGGYRWILGEVNSQAQTAGTVALAFLPIILGTQMLLQAILLDIMDKPVIPLHKIIKDS